MKKSALKIAIAAAAFASAGAMAATDGTLGTTSTGDVLVQVSKGSVVQITGLNDLILGNWTAASLTATVTGTSQTDQFCVYSSVSNYHATVSSLNGAAYQAPVVGTCADPSGGVDPTICDAGDSVADGSAAVPGTYLMGNGAGSFVTYTPSINATTADGSAQGPFVGNSIDVLCGGGTNASVSAAIAANALNAVPDGNYQDTLTIMVSPN